MAYFILSHWECTPGSHHLTDISSLTFDMEKINWLSVYIFEHILFLSTSKRAQKILTNTAQRLFCLVLFLIAIKILQFDS